MSQKVLIIEDTKPIQALLRSRLRDEPVEILTVDSAAEGLRAAVDAAPDLILLDMSLPNEDPLDTCRQLKADPRTTNIPIILLIGQASPASKVRYLDLGVTDYIPKPFDPADLIARVRAALKTKYLIDLLATKGMLDGQTGLWNKHYFEHRLHNEIALQRRHGQPLALVRVYIDALQTINDELGHLVGDHVMKCVAAVLTSSGRTEDIVCRLGGGDFAILTPGTPASRALTLATRICRGVSSLSMTHRGTPLHATCSIGVADIADQPNPTQPAEEALSQARQQGGNRAILHTPASTLTTTPAPEAA